MTPATGNGKAPIPIRTVPLSGGATPPTPPPLACPGLYREAGTANHDEWFLDPHLVAELDVHLARHRTPGVSLRARGLVVYGAAGETKSSTVRAALSRRGVDVLETSMARFSGSTEGRPVELLDTVLDFVRNRTAQTGRQMAVHGHDLDASNLYESPREERTVNTRIARGAFQTILDSDDTFLDGNGRPIPWIFTANSLEGFPAPLIRDGRCKVIHYHLPWQRKAEMLITTFGAKKELDRRRLQCLAYHYQDQSLVWMLSLAGDLEDAAISQAVAKHGLDNDDAIRAAARPKKLDVRALFRAAKARQAAIETKDDRRKS